MDFIAAKASEYVVETRRLNALPTSTEETFYPDIRDLLTAILRSQNLPFEVRTGTSEAKAGGTDRPDFVLADPALFVGVFGEVKKPDVSLEEIAVSTERDDQIGRYLTRTGVALITNVRSFGLLACAPSYVRCPERLYRRSSANSSAAWICGQTLRAKGRSSISMRPRSKSSSR